MSVHVCVCVCAASLPLTPPHPPLFPPPPPTPRQQLYDALLQNAGAIIQPLAAREVAPRVAQLAARSDSADVRAAAAAVAALQASAAAPAPSSAAAPLPAQPPGLATGSIGGYPLLGGGAAGASDDPLAGVEAAWCKLAGDVEAAGARFAALARLLRAGPAALVDAGAPPVATAQGPVVPLCAAFLDGFDFLEQALPRLAALIHFGANCERVVMDEALFSRTLAVHEAGTLLLEVAAAVAGGRGGAGAPDFPQLAPAAVLDDARAPAAAGAAGAAAAPPPGPPAAARAASSIDALADLFAPAAPAAAPPGSVFEAEEEGGGGVSPVPLPRPLSGAPLLLPPPAAGRTAVNPLAQAKAAPAADPFDSL